MQDKEHEWHDSQDKDKKEDVEEQIQVPATLLSGVLYSLGLPPEQNPSALSLADLTLQLRSTVWEERVQALHSLEKLKHPVSVDLLAPLLHDEDETVRATTVYILGAMGKSVPLHWLVEALHDPNWHVREATVFALAKQGSRLPIEVLMTALHDNDGSVREAASFALQHISVKEGPSVLYGQLREEKTMQQEQHDPMHLNGNHKSHFSETSPHDNGHNTFLEYSTNVVHAHRVSEQAQTYAAGQYAPQEATSQEAPSYEYAEGVMASQHEKVTSYRMRRKSHKGWWAAIIITALLFLGFGRLSITVLPQNIPDFNSKVQIGVPGVAVVPEKSIPFYDPADALIMQNALSKVLHLTPLQITEQWDSQGTLEAVAAHQGVMESQLHTAETDAFNQILKNAENAGKIDQKGVLKLQLQLQSDTGFRNDVIKTLLKYSPPSNVVVQP